MDAPSGALTAVSGANGAGKTTLLRILATLLRADGGDAWVAGAHVGREPERVRGRIGVALVNDRGLYWRLSGSRNLEFFGRALGLSRADARTDAARVAAEMGIEGFAGRPVATYSAGQRQRLVLARASLADPAVLLIDEPMRGLDEDGIARARAMMLRHARRGAAVLVAAPTIAEFSDLCDTRIVLRGGRAEAA